MIFLSFAETISGIREKIFPDFRAVLIQLVATFLLFLIVKHFFYKTAKEFVRKRKEYIEKEVNEATNKNIRAERTLREAKKIHQDNLNSSDKLLKESRMQAKQEKEQIIKEARLEASKLKDKAKAEIELEKDKARDELKEEMLDLSIEMSKNILKREVTSEDEKKNLDDLLDEVNKDD